MKMKRTLTAICLVFLCTTIGFAQGGTPKNLFYGNIGFGFETNYGHTGVLMGLGYQKSLSRKFIFQTDVNHFTSEIIDNDWSYKKEPNEEGFYRATFYSTRLGYAIIGNIDRFNITVKTGFTLCHLKSLDLSNYPYTVLESGLKVDVPSTKVHYEENRLVGACNFGIDANFPINQKHIITVGFSSYAFEGGMNFLFFPLPVISYKFNL